MDTRLTYGKNFNLNENLRLHCTNPELAEEFITETLHLIHKADTCKQAECIIDSLLLDVLEAYEQDKDNQLSTLTSSLTIITDEDKEDFWNRKLVLFYLQYYYGEPLIKYHEKLVDKNRTMYLATSNVFTVNYNAMYTLACVDYYTMLRDGGFQVKLPGIQQVPVYIDKAYSATIILPILIEHALMSELQNWCIVNGIKKILETAEEDALSDFEKETFAPFIGKNRRYHGSYRMILKNLNRIFQDRKISYDKGILEPDLSLNMLSERKCYKESIRPQYKSLIEILFKKKNLNLRNGIMHGDDTSVDYYSIHLTGILYQLFLDIVGQKVFNDPFSFERTYQEIKKS